MGFLQFVRLYGNTRAKLRVLFILARHPFARFDHHAFSVSPEGYHLDLSEGLEDLVAEGVVEEHPRPEGFSLYSLADNAERRQPVVKLAGLDLGQAQVLASLVLSPGVGPIPNSRSAWLRAAGGYRKEVA